MPTDGDGKTYSCTSVKESEKASAESKRGKDCDRNSGEQDDEKRPAYKLKLKAGWNNFREHGPKWIEAGCAVLLVIITGSYTRVAWHQWDEMKQTNNLTKEAMHSSGRAWVGVEKITSNSFDKGADVDSDSRFLLSVTFTLRNYGHSAAQHVRIFPRLEAADRSTMTTGICDDPKAGVYVGDVILPEQERDYPEGVRITVVDMESALKRQNPAMGRNLILSLRGCVEYIDDPGEMNPHHTPFSYFVMRTGRERYFTPDLQSVPGGDIGLSPAALYPGPTD